MREEILVLVRFHTGSNKECAGQDDLLGVFGLDRDDAPESLEDYAARFGVDPGPIPCGVDFSIDCLGLVSGILTQCVPVPRAISRELAASCIAPGPKPA